MKSAPWDYNSWIIASNLHVEGIFTKAAKYSGTLSEIYGRQAVTGML